VAGFDTSGCQTPCYDAALMREKEAWYFRDAFLRDYLKTDIEPFCSGWIIWSTSYL
jgi:hypothetical protein